MIGKIEMVQESPVEGVMILRVNTYREQGEVGYEEHHVQVPVFPDLKAPLGGYAGKIDDMGQPVDRDDYKKWVASLPKVWQNNPCLNTFIAVPILTPPIMIEQIIADHITRLKTAPVNVATGFPKVIDPSIQGGLKAQLLLSGLAVTAKPRSISGKDAIKPAHELLAVEVKG